MRWQGYLVIMEIYLSVHVKMKTGINMHDLAGSDDKPNLCFLELELINAFTLIDMMKEFLDHKNRPGLERLVATWKFPVGIS